MILTFHSFQPSYDGNATIEYALATTKVGLVANWNKKSARMDDWSQRP